MAIGMTIGTASQWFFIQAVRDKAIRAGGKAPPEARLPVGMAGALICPIGLLWFALSSYSGMTFFMPLIGIMIFGIGVSRIMWGFDVADRQSVFVFTCVWGFLVASFPRYAASAMAGNTLVRCLWAAGFPLFADPVSRTALYTVHIDDLDVSWLGSGQSDQYLSWSCCGNGTYPFRTLFFRIKVEE